MFQNETGVWVQYAMRRLMVSKRNMRRWICCVLDCVSVHVYRFVSKYNLCVFCSSEISGQYLKAVCLGADCANHIIHRVPNAKYRQCTYIAFWGYSSLGVLQPDCAHLSIIGHIDYMIILRSACTRSHWKNKLFAHKWRWASNSCICLR